IDWKFGRVPVPDVSGNLQLAAYALGAMQLTGATRCVAHVFQPRIKAHTCHEFTRPDAIARNIRRVIDRATSGPLVLEAGEQCRYCKAKAVCPAFKAQTDALAVMRDSTKALTTPETLATYYAKAQIVKRFCTQVEDAMKAYLDEHGECAGYAYQEVAGRREVSDICGLCFAVSDIITRGEFLECCTASTAQVESLYVDKVCAAASAKGEKLTKKDAKERFEAGAAAFISRAKPTRIVVFKEVAQ
ncbi:MAG: DUF2800 domain-containing protein, partial [Victivallales bacterium]|nr:DUF2800 domain-containing protein [Victivallales bacterium]